MSANQATNDFWMDTTSRRDRLRLCYRRPFGASEGLAQIKARQIKNGSGEEKPSGVVSLWCRLTRSRVLPLGTAAGLWLEIVLRHRAEGFDGFALYMVMDGGKAHHVITEVGGGVLVAVSCGIAPLLLNGPQGFKWPGVSPGDLQTLGLSNSTQMEVGSAFKARPGGSGKISRDFQSQASCRFMRSIRCSMPRDIPKQSARTITTPLRSLVYIAGPEVVKLVEVPPSSRASASHAA